MFQEPDYRENLSLKLSEVLDDIGVNEKIVMRRRRSYMLQETMGYITEELTGKKLPYCFTLGSQIEGTTTKGLKSDFDILLYPYYINIMQDMENFSDWEDGKFNFLMIQDENTTPGYCFLQMFRLDVPQPVTDSPFVRLIPTLVTDIKGKNLCKNTSFVFEGDVMHGPASVILGEPGFYDRDHVIALHCKRWPQSTSGWLDRQGIGRWPTQDMKRYAASTGCFVVGTGSKVGEYPELEWRISTSLSERFLMFNLNITQIRCYVLLKMILKSCLNPQAEINISSFMCKTVLLNCIENTEQSIWRENNLFKCLIHCLLELHRCLQNDRCSHFIIQENNLMAGQFTAENKHDLSKTITEFIQNDGHGLLGIDIDELGQRLQVKVNTVPHRAYKSSDPINEYQMTLAYINIASHTSLCHMLILEHLHNENITTMKQSVVKLMTFRGEGNRLQKAAFKFLAPFIFTTYGSVLASSSIGQNNQVSPEALVWLSAGLNSDFSSSRLKKASVFYSTGDMEEAELILRHIEEQYCSNPVLHICACWKEPLPGVTSEFKMVCVEQSEDCIKHFTAFCVRFIQKEINCVPHELKYEMFRSTQHDMIHRDNDINFWMDWVVVDSLPFLYFLQYKIYRHLQRHQDQRQALRKLIITIATDENLRHKETALNILGQCIEQEDKPQEALKCYLFSLQQRARNNVANIHICKLLSRILAGR